MTASELPRAARRAALLIFTLSWFVTLGFRPLFHPDEGRYAEIPREMLAGGDWVIPHLNGLAYLEKPPLQYWATAVAYALFGTEEWSARLWAGLTGFLMVLVVAWAGRSLWDRQTGRRAGILCASALMPVVFGHLLTLDMGVSFFMTGTVLALCVAQHARTSASASGGWMLLAWTFAACALLSKGLIGIVLPGAVFVIYTLWHRDLVAWRKLQIRWGLPLFLLIALPWHLLAQRRHADFFDFYIVREHFLRYATTIADRVEPWWYFGPVLLVGMLPWLPQLLRAYGSVRRSVPHGQFDAARFLWLWIVFVTVFFSVSDSKLVPYVLPVVPAVALLAARAPERAARREILLAAAIGVLLGIGLSIGAAILPDLLRGARRGHYFLALRVPIAVMGMLLAAGSARAITTLRRSPAPGGTTAAYGWLGGAAYSALCVLLLSAGAVGPIYSGRSLAELVPASLAKSVPVYSVRTYEQTLPFYWGRTVTLVDYRGELDHGLHHDRSHYLPTIEQFERVWIGEPQALAVMEPAQYDQLARQGLPMRRLGANERRILVSRR